MNKNQDSRKDCSKNQRANQYDKVLSVKSILSLKQDSSHHLLKRISPDLPGKCQYGPLFDFWDLGFCNANFLRSLNGLLKSNSLRIILL